MCALTRMTLLGRYFRSNVSLGTVFAAISLEDLKDAQRFMGFARLEVTSFPKTSMSGLIILWLSYALVGWKLFWADIIYYVVFLVSAVAILFAMQEEPWIQGVFGYVPQAITVMLILSLLLTFVITLPATLYLVVLPALSTLLAWQDMDSTAYGAIGSRTKSKLWRLGGIALLGLLFGEAISVSFLPGGALS